MRKHERSVSHLRLKRRAGDAVAVAKTTADLAGYVSKLRPAWLVAHLLARQLILHDSVEGDMQRGSAAGTQADPSWRRRGRKVRTACKWSARVAGHPTTRATRERYPVVGEQSPPPSGSTLGHVAHEKQGRPKVRVRPGRKAGHRGTSVRVRRQACAYAEAGLGHSARLTAAPTPASCTAARRPGV